MERTKNVKSTIYCTNIFQIVWTWILVTIRVQYPFRISGGTVVSMGAVSRHGLTLGWQPYSKDSSNVDSVDDQTFPSNLGLTLTWSDDIAEAVADRSSDNHRELSSSDDNKTWMKTHVIRGMPYATMQYSAHTRAVVSSELPQMNSTHPDNPIEFTSQTTVHIDDALPHHTDKLLQYSFPDAPEHSTTTTNLPCTISLHGYACFVRGNSWIMREDLGDHTTILTKLPPDSASIENLAPALATDINFTLPPEYQAGAGDTYFSGKQLAKLGRIVSIGYKLKELAAMAENELQAHYKPKDSDESVDS